MRGVRQCFGVTLATAVAVLALGCLHGDKGDFGHPPMHHDGAAQYPVPPTGAVPRELDKITLPPYVIEAPDQLLIEVIHRYETTETDEKTGEPIKINGKEKKKTVTSGLPIQPVSGQFAVRPDGTVGLGFWGSVPVSGLTLDQAAESIRAHVLKQEALSKMGVKTEFIHVIVDVIAYNSKRYYVITDGGGLSSGEQVISFPITGSETVLDALSNIYGLPDVASKRNIWVARRTPYPGQPWQILPVDWIGMTQHGITYTNYQIMPGDRIYVKAQSLVSIDRTLARIISPIERVFGITLLGSSTVNQIRGVNVNGTGQ
jgi:polysaccharide export outer membrane protein